MTIEVFTDGSSRGNPGSAGWGFVVKNGIWAYGCEKHATNQRMELMAAIKAVDAISGSLRVISDSKYVVDCFGKQWWRGWIKRGWLNARKEPIINRDLWEPFIKVVLDRGNVEFQWVKGHTNNVMNDAADYLATTAASSQTNKSGDNYISIDTIKTS